MNRRTVRTIAAVAGLAAATLFGSTVSAQALASSSFTYQGELKDSGGLANGTYDLSFKLFNSLNAQVGSTLLANGVNVTDGKFTVNLDFGDVFAGQALSLEMAVRPTGGGVYVTLAPRQDLAGTPYAQAFQIPLNQSNTYATGPMVNLTNASTAPASSVMRLTGGSPSGTFGAGTGYSPTLGVDTATGNGVTAYTSATAAYTMYARAAGASSIALVADQAAAGARSALFRSLDAANASNCVEIAQAGTGRALQAYSANLANTANLVDLSQGGTGRAMYISAGNAASTSNGVEVVQLGTGRAALFTNSNADSTLPTLTATNAGTGDSIPNGSQDNGIAIKGVATGGFGIGVMGRGIEAGVFGYSGTTGGAGIWGSTGGGGGSVSTGVRGDGNGAGTSGVAAFNNLGNAVYAQTSSGAAIFATNGGGSGYAGDFNGKVRITGTLQVTSTVSKGGGSFQIDHPLDPENKYLYHSFVESPDMKNIYDGVIALDSKGEATVTMPDWFNALNTDFRYQLTCVGGFAPVYISDEIAGNTFKIAGGKPGMKVSWQVTGTRHDAYAKAHRIPVEETKSDADKGKYLCPEGFGKPESMRIGTPTMVTPEAPKMN